jgi:cell division transport system permease protein
MKKPLFKVQAISVYISTTLVLLLLGAMGIMFVFGQSLSKDLQENIRVSVIIDNSADEEEIQALQKKIGEERYVRTMEYISREQALAEETEALKINPVEQLGYNPYEPSIEIGLKSGYSNSDSLTVIEKELTGNGIVSEVLYQKGLVDSVNNNMKKAGAVLLALLVMLSLISWSLISNLVRLSIYSKRFLLHTMKLVGAKWCFIRKPFITSNMTIGFLSGILANAILAAAIYTILQEEPSLAAYLPVNGLLAVAAVVLIFGITICSLCAFLSVNRFLRMRNNDLYFV